MITWKINHKSNQVLIQDEANFIILDKIQIDLMKQAFDNPPPNNVQGACAGGCGSTWKPQLEAKHINRGMIVYALNEDLLDKKPDEGS